jgi:hypothetical protein
MPCKHLCSLVCDRRGGIAHRPSDDACLPGIALTSSAKLRIRWMVDWKAAGERQTHLSDTVIPVEVIIVGEVALDGLQKPS